MIGKKVGLAETPPTNLAHKRFLPRMDPHVDVPFSLGGKTFSTGLAAVRLLSFVTSDMVFQVVGLRELFSTGVTPIRFLPCVDPRVDGQRSLGGKTHSAEVAAVRLLSSVTHDMDVKVGQPSEPFSAGDTLMRFLSCVDCHVSF